MRNIFKYSLLVSFMVVFASCENGFDELNTSKTGALEIDPAYQLNQAIVSSSTSGGFAGGSSIIYDYGVVQQIISPNSGVLTGANFNQDNKQATQTLWQQYYRNVVRNTADVMERTKDDASRSNIFNMAKIYHNYALMVLTDNYGDIPYFEAGRGYYDQNFTPGYDAQEDIYPAIIQAIQEASAALNSGGRIETADILYAGDVAKWKKFANSLLLRAGMRLSEVAPGVAESVVSALNPADLIVSNDDNAVIRHDNNYQNGLGVTLNGTEGANLYLAEPFVEHLRSTNDPRLAAIAVRYQGATSGPEQANAANGNADPHVTLTRDPADQVGMPMGHDNSTIDDVADDLGLASFYDFSQVDRKRVAKLTAPMFIVTAAQTNLLLAEAAERGWASSGDAATYFEAGVRSALEQMALYDAASAIDAQDIDDYVAANPYNSGTGFDQIATQYWIASFLQGSEGFANLRRTNLPALAPNPYPGREVDWIYRYTYPTSEISVNPNVASAISRMGGDQLDVKVWWDAN